MLECRTVFWIAVIILAFSSKVFAETGKAIEIDHSEQLFLDDHLVENTTNITRKVNTARKHPVPVLKPEYPWEKNNIAIFGKAMYDQEEKIFKIWYYCAGSVAYATSKDGLHWEKPKLDEVLYNGQKTNIVIERSPQIEKGIMGPFGDYFENFGVIKDYEDPDPTRRYKLLFISLDFDYDGSLDLPPDSYTSFDQTQRRGLGVAVSPDGIHWELENDYVNYAVCDISHFFFDDSTKRFVLFGRNFIDKSEGPWVKAGDGRAVVRLDSPDCREWSTSELVLAADSQDPPETEIYSMSVFPYEGIYIGLVQVYYSGKLQGNLEIQLASSRDGKTFTRIEPRQAFIPEGSVGEWDRFNISVGDMPPVEINDELSFYYAGLNQRHEPYYGDDTSNERFSAIGVAKIKSGRFLSLQSSFDSGIVLTKPLSFTGSTLSINANALYGSIHIELLDEQGELMPGFEATISGEDDIAIPVIWNRGTLKELSGKNIKIRFTIKNYELYGFRI